MKLSRVRIEAFRRFGQALEINALEDGLNLFTGPNEAGKSTVVAAIRAAFFERYRSSSVDDFRPWGDSSAAPAVELDFSIGGTDYRLAKRFLSRARCELKIGSRALDGADAEDHLAALLGFQHAGRGASRLEHWGIPGLLWIEQGGAHQIHAAVEHASDPLRAALKASLGEVASSAGDEILEVVEARRNELLTPAGGRPRGIYEKAQGELAGLGEELTALEAEAAAYRDKVDALATLRAAHAADEEQKPWLALREQQQAAAEALEGIRRLSERLAAERRNAERLTERGRLLHAQLDTYIAQESAGTARRAALERATSEHARADALVEQWAARHLEAEARHRGAREALRRAREGDTRRALARQRQEALDKSALGEDALARADAVHAAVGELGRQAAGAAIEVATLDRLRAQRQQMRELEIRAEAAATRLRYSLAEGREIELDGERLSGSGERHVVQASNIVLPGLGQLEIAPGGADLPRLAREREKLADAHRAALQGLGLDSLEDAESRHQRHTRLNNELRTASATLAALAPQGIDALRNELTALRARADELSQALEKLPAAPDDRPELSLVEAEAEEASATTSLGAASEGLHCAQLAAGKARSGLDAAQRELAAAQALLDAPERATRLADTQRDLALAAAEQATLAAGIGELERQLGAAQPGLLEQDVERLRRSAEQQEVAHGTRRDTLMRLEVELQAAGAQGLDERRAELARDLSLAQRRADELRRRAAALDYLLSLLREKRRALTRRLQAPLQAHLEHYLRILFPQASIEIDEDLRPGPLTRGSESGEFAALSFGAREQMGVISRLAYADLLREAGWPTLIILDDALVHSDEARLAQMKRVLFDAAGRHQILLFSCHPESWRDLGVRARPLGALTS